MATRKRQTQSRQPEKFYTFSVLISFHMQHTFTAKEVQPAEEGGEADVDPTDAALAELEDEIQEYLFQQYPVEAVEAWADFDGLLGIEDAIGVVKPSVQSVGQSKREKSGAARRSKR